LFGVNEETGMPSVYIGEAENVFTRLKDHILNKEFWNEVIFFTNKDENLTKSHVKYLESRLCELSSNANRYQLENGNKPQTPTLPRGDRDAMEEFIENIKILLGVMGHRTLEAYHQTTISKQSQSDSMKDKLFTFSAKNVNAEAQQTDEGIVVLSGSLASKTFTDSLSKGYREFRERLLDNGILVEEDKHMKFTQDQLFSSPSQAAAIIIGYPMNGRLCWKTEDGKTIKEVEESNIENLS